MSQKVQIGQARQALEGATSTLQNNLVTALTSLANASAIAGSNVSHAAALLVRGLVSNTFSLGGVVAYMPRLIFLDGPTQFIETLRLIRSNQIRVPSDMNGAIDTLLVFAGQVRDSGVGNNFTPLVTFFPNIFVGVGDFLTTLIDSVFTFIAPSASGTVGVGGGAGAVPILMPGGGAEPGAPVPVRKVGNVVV